MTLSLFDHEFQTARPARPVYCHQEFLDKLDARRSEPAGKRASLLLQRMAVDLGRIHYKSTSGSNQGWRRSRLGGGSGSHFYAWWAPAGAAPFRQGSFENKNDAVFLRDIRHHDDHAVLTAGDFTRDYLALSVPDLRSGEYAPEPWTSSQVRFARSRGIARILKGHPGSGKTTALLHAADESQAGRVLYLTFSPQLAALARDYFDRFCSKERTFTVLTYPAFLRQLVDWRPANEDPAEARGQFRRDLFNHQRSLGAFSSDLDALYDELHAHAVGSALPEKTGRFAKAERIRLPDAAYRAQRDRYLGGAAANVIDAMHRLERANGAPLADRYFPGLALAWRAAQALGASDKFNRAFLDYDCVAVDEVQDLTPVEAFVVLALSRKLNERVQRAPLLLAGDEAQTVQPTDFEWAWLNDMLHAMLGQPQEFKLAVNLRSPRRIADLVNRSWDYYDYLHKQDRPSGSGYAEIDDDSPDQVLYAALRPGELPDVLTELSTREGLAVVAFDKSGLPPEALPFTLSPAEVKGLDFDSVCVVNGGAALRRIVDERSVNAVDMLEKRLAIDKLRVALSRPTERLIWVDVAPDESTVKETGLFLHSSSETRLHPVSAEGLRASLSEEELSVEERVQRCQRDARQFVDVKPDLAWSRAHQAVSLLRVAPDLTVISDPATREIAYMTLAEVCFQLGFRKKALSPELGRPNLFEQARNAAYAAKKPLLAHALEAMGAVDMSPGLDRLNAIAAAIQAVTGAASEIPAWVLVEITPRADSWLSELGRHLEAGDNPLIANRILPPFFDALGFADAQARKDRLTQRSIEILMKKRRYADALRILESIPDAQPKLAAECYEAVGDHRRAAEIFMKLGDREKALRCYRSAPDFSAALELVGQMEGHPARPALEWLSELDRVLAKRPDNFNRVMMPPEKKLLEAMLEKGLGVQRKKAAPKKPAPKKETPAAAKRAKPKRPPRE